jgi:hypothetical protein
MEPFMEKAGETNLTEYEHQVLHSFPVLSQEELDKVNGLYKPYVFYKTMKGGREVSCTTCHEHRFIPYLKELMTPEDYVFMDARHNDEVKCPFCGAEAQLKNIPKCKSFEKLFEEHQVSFFHAVGNAVYVQCYWTRKNYEEIQLSDYPRYATSIVYHFMSGEAMMFYLSWGEWQIEAERFRIGKRFRICEPFAGAGGFTTGHFGYTSIGFETAMAAGPFRYSQAVNWNERHGSLMRYLTAWCLYPKAVEMFMKSGMIGTIEDLVFRMKKNAAAIKWDEKDPRRAFGLDGSELKAFMALPEHPPDVITAYKKLKKSGIKMPFAEIRNLRTEVWQIGLLNFIDTAKRFKTTPIKFRNYLDKYVSKCSHGGGFYSLSSVFSYWTDYIDAAKAIGYDIDNPMVTFPKRLNEAHDNATGEHRRRLTAEQEQRRREEKARQAKENAERKAAWEKEEKERLEREAKEREARESRFCWEADGYLIRPARNADEVIAEGKALEHCVAGYAKRHEEGKLTICFMRRVEEPDKPYLTIEMQGKEFKQIHGYKNEGLYSQKGRFAPDPREVHKEYLDTWLAWVKDGSKRDKDGAPVLPKPKTKKKKERKAA